MPFNPREFNRLSDQSELFDKMYCKYNALDIAPETEVLEAHEAIITGYQALIAGLSQNQKKVKASIYNNMHVQYEGLRKYYGICFDKTPNEAIAKKRELLDKQYTCNVQCVFYTHSSRDTYASLSDKKFEAAYLKEYEDVKTWLNDAKKRLNLEQPTTASNLRIDTSAPPLLVREVSKHTEAGIGHLLSLRQSSSSSDEDSIVCASVGDHSECASTLLEFASPRVRLPQKSIELINQCWRDLHLLSQSKKFEAHPQYGNLIASVQLLATIKIALEEDESSQNIADISAPSLSTQSFMAPPKPMGVKRSSQAEEQEDEDSGACHTRKSRRS